MAKPFLFVIKGIQILPIQKITLLFLSYNIKMNKDFNITPCTPDFETPRPCRSLLRINRKKEKRIRHCHQKKSNKKIGMWNLNQTVKYITFIREHFQMFENEDTRRKLRVFSLMRKEIKTRSAIQCRSHHQKMVQTYGSLEDIILHYENKVIPYYQGRLKERQTTQKPVEEAQTFCVVVQSNNHFRIELNAQMILSF